MGGSAIITCHMFDRGVIAGGFDLPGTVIGFDG